MVFLVWVDQALGGVVSVMGNVNGDGNWGGVEVRIVKRVLPSAERVWTTLDVCSLGPSGSEEWSSMGRSRWRPEVVTSKSGIFERSSSHLTISSYVGTGYLEAKITSAIGSLSITMLYTKLSNPVPNTRRFSHPSDPAMEGHLNSYPSCYRFLLILRVYEEHPYL